MTTDNDKNIFPSIKKREEFLTKRQQLQEERLIEEIKQLTIAGHRIIFGETTRIKINDKTFEIKWCSEEDNHFVSIYLIKPDAKFPSLVISRSLLPNGREIERIRRSAAYLINEILSLYENIYGFWEKDITFNEEIYRLNSVYSIAHIMEFIEFQMFENNRMLNPDEQITQKLENRIRLLRKYN